MEERFARRYQQPERRGWWARLKLAIAAVLLILGAVLAWVGQRCVALARHWADEPTMRVWGKAIDDFQRAPTPTEDATTKGYPTKARWEHHVQRIGPPILLATGGALVVLWTVLGLGGVAVWLASHGYGFFLLLGAVTIGVLVGNSWAAPHRPRPNRDRSAQDRQN